MHSEQQSLEGAGFQGQLPPANRPVAAWFWQPHPSHHPLSSAAFGRMCFIIAV